MPSNTAFRAEIIRDPSYHGAITCLASAGHDLVCSGDSNGIVKVWDWASKTVLQSLTLPDSQIPRKKAIAGLGHRRLAVGSCSLTADSPSITDITIAQINDIPPPSTRWECL
ncbi:MAG: hypothetical protein CL521_00725 [Actinobacteria bacterium]|nr:hypothetical protein [Actinomycetota bacterium]|tara:strand:+ start:143 stop:478 length:336 start_codon:yes stop_codon:yes gene_type:complete